jgi:hypothetical protein
MPAALASFPASSKNRRAWTVEEEQVGVSWGEVVSALAVMGIVTFLLLL